MTAGASKSLWMATEGIDDAMFNARPQPGANSVNFVYFHVLRHWVQDINRYCRGQIAEEDAWHRYELSKAMGYEPLGKGTDGIGTGYGYSAAEVNQLPDKPEVLHRYHRILEEETAEFLTGLDPATLDAAGNMDGNDFTVGRQLRHLIAHTFLHIGDIEYAKGLLNAEPADLPSIS